MNQVTTRTRATLCGVAGISAVLSATLALSVGASVGWMPSVTDSRDHRWGATRLCADRRGESLDAWSEFVDVFLALTPKQREVWDWLTATVRVGQASIQTACQELTATEPATSAPERLAQLERLMVTSLAVVRDVRPAFERFYGVLTDAQRQALDRLASRRHAR